MRVNTHILKAHIDSECSYMLVSLVGFNRTAAKALQHRKIYIEQHKRGRLYPEYRCEHIISMFCWKDQNL